MHKAVKRFFIRFHKQIKGIISLFLALTLLPFSSFAILITESARYQNIAELLEEIIDGSAFSTLADYDAYLDKRFDLVATGQTVDVSNNFSKYMTENMSAVGKNATLKSASAEGEFALSDPDILKAQIQENTGPEVVIELVEDVGDIEEFLKNLKKSFGGQMETMTKAMDVTQKSMDIVKDVTEVVECIKETVELYDYYKDVQNTYGEKAAAFEKAVLQIPIELEKAEKEIEAQKNAQSTSAPSGTTSNPSTTPTPTPEPVEQDPYKHANVISAINTAETAAAEYKSAASTLLSKFDDFTKKYISATDKIRGLPKKVSDVKEAFKDAIDDRTVADTIKWTDEITKQVLKLLPEINADSLKNKVNDGKNHLNTQIEALRNFSGHNVTKNWTHSTLEQNHFTPVVLQVEPQGYRDDVNLVANGMVDLTTFDEDVSMTDILDLLDKIMGINFLYDEALNANVPASAMFASTNTNGMNASTKVLLASMQTLINSTSDFADAITKVVEGNVLEKLVGVLKAGWSLVELLAAIVEFIAAAITWFADLVAGTVNLIGDAVDDGVMKTLILAAYAGYYLPNRTNCYSGKALNGYSYSELFGAAGGSYGISAFGSMNTLLENKDINAISEEIPMFKGAEGEYVLIGSRNEIENQMAAAFNLYMVRFLLDMGLVIKGSGTAIDAAASFGSIKAWIIKVVMMLIEPMLDVIILQNGGKQYLFKEKLYLSPHGIAALAHDLLSVTDMYEGLKKSVDKEITGKVQDHYDPFEEDDDLATMKGMFMMDYTEYLIMLTLLMTSNDRIVERLQDIIQMEAAQQEKATNTFSLEQSYTYIRTDVEAELNPMFQIESLSKTGVFDVRRTQHTGY